MKIVIFLFQVYRYSFLARYAAVDVATNGVVDILPSGTTEGYLQNFIWGPSGTSCAFVYLNNIFYKANLTAEPQQISTNGQLYVVYNGIPDWVYEGNFQLSLQCRVIMYEATLYMNRIIKVYCHSR